MIANAISVIVCACSFVYTCYVLCGLTYFLSRQDDKYEIRSDGGAIQFILWPFFVDILLICSFLLQHSIMARDLVVHTFCKLHMEHVRRSIYNICSSLAIHFLINKWQQIPISLWNINVTSDTVSMLFSGLHVFAWSTIYSGCIMMDISELSGIKQVFYRVTGRNSPMDIKSKELKRYLRHMRHPSFTGFLIILWLRPSMSLDRLLLASLLTLYMALMWTIDSEDYGYHVLYFRRKQTELS